VDPAPPVRTGKVIKKKIWVLYMKKDSEFTLTSSWTSSKSPTRSIFDILSLRIYIYIYMHTKNLNIHQIFSGGRGIRLFRFSQI